MANITAVLASDGSADVTFNADSNVAVAAASTAATADTAVVAWVASYADATEDPKDSMSVTETVDVNADVGADVNADVDAMVTASMEIRAYTTAKGAVVGVRSFGVDKAFRAKPPSSSACHLDDLSLISIMS